MRDPEEEGLARAANAVLEEMPTLSAADARKAAEIAVRAFNNHMIDMAMRGRVGTARINADGTVDVVQEPQKPKQH